MYDSENLEPVVRANLTSFTFWHHTFSRTDEEQEQSEQEQLEQDGDNRGGEGANQASNGEAA